MKRPKPRASEPKRPALRLEAVALGASAGAVEALSLLLAALPRGYTLPLLVVVHAPPDQDSAITELLQTKCRIAVKEAEDKEPIQGGTVYFAPPNYHLLVEPDRRLSLSSDEPVLFSRPSIDVLFESAADVYGRSLAGIILTGGSSDGSHGLQAVCAAGGVGLVQSPESAQASTMPQMALAACPEARALSLDQIAQFLQDLSRRRTP
jgi:two-component system, chemotaxis family, protein-glutamate methylesterase/glutaminase